MAEDSGDTACTAFNEDGTQCDCDDFEKKSKKDTCRRCGHKAKRHTGRAGALPAPTMGQPPAAATISSIVAKYSTTQRSLTTDEHARREATMGFRPMLASGGPSKGGYNASGQGSRVTSGSSRLQQSSISAGKVCVSSFPYLP